MNSDENKNKRIGMVTSIGIHLTLFLIFFFLTAWRAPNPPNPEFGIELNFGLDNEGSGDVQPIEPVGDNSDKDSKVVEQQTTNANPEEVKSDTKEEAIEAEVDKSKVQNDSKLESPLLVKEEKKEEKKEKPKETKSKEKLIAEYKKEDKKETATEDGSKKGDPVSQGDGDKKVGDQGDKDGKLESKALYGTQGGGGGGDGFGLSMTGWDWADKPRIPELPDTENGKVIFEIECDENGEITKIDTKERSLSPKAEQILKDEIRKNSLIRTSDGRAPERSKGRIIFILKIR